jgi:hypothetical protein
MLLRFVLATCAFTFVSAAADQVIGTWKLNTAKSKYTGMPMPKEQTVVYTPEGQGWRYQAKGTAADGQPINTSFVYAKDNEDMKMTGSAFADTLAIRNGASDTSTGTFKRGGKKIGSAKRVISKDGKTMTITGNVTLPDGKKGSYTAVYEKQ